MFNSTLLALCLARSPSSQPESGPGGSDYAHGSARVSIHRTGEKRDWLREPADPTSASAPLIRYLHGYGSQNDGSDAPLLEHQARHGMSVLYPRYGGLLDPWNCENGVVNARRDGLDTLAEPEHVEPEMDRFAIAKHSLGGILQEDASAPQPAPGSALGQEVSGGGKIAGHHPRGLSWSPRHCRRPAHPCRPSPPVPPEPARVESDRSPTPVPSGSFARWPLRSPGPGSSRRH